MTSKLLAFGDKTSSGASVVYTVPAGKTARLRYSMVRNNAGPSAELAMAVRRGGLDVYWHDSLAVTAGQTVQRILSIHLDAGDSVVVYSSTAGHAQYIVSGEES